MREFISLNEALEELKKIDESLNKGFINPSSLNVDSEVKLLEKRIEDLYEQIKLIIAWLKKFILPKNDNFAIQGGYLLYSGKRPKEMSYEVKDILDVISEGMELLEDLCVEFKEHPIMPEGKEVIYKFMYVYNSLVSIVQSSDEITSNYKSYLVEIVNKANNKNNDANQKELNERLANVKNYLSNRRNFSSSNLKKIEFGNGYDDEVFLGYEISKSLDNDVVRLANRLLGLDISNVCNNNPVYYKLDTADKPIIINCTKEDIENKKYSVYLEKLLMYFIAGLPAKKVRFAGIECDATIKAGLLSEIIVGFKDIFYQEKTASYVHDITLSAASNNESSMIAENESNAIKLLNYIVEIEKKRKDKYSLFSRKKYENPSIHANFFDFNKDNPDNQDDLIVLIVNNYPKGFAKEEAKAQLENLMNSQEYGIVVIVLQNTTAELYEQKDMMSKIEYKLITEDDYNYISDIDVNNSIFTYNGKHLSYENNIYDKSLTELSNEVKRLLAKITQFNTEDLLAKLGNTKRSALETSLRIPVGLSDDSFYDFISSIDGSPHGIVLGGTGSGKTAFLHTLILSGANMYSPDELQFYLTDFKTERGSGAFGDFLVGKSMHIPHVKYLALDTSPENVQDMLDMILQIHNERCMLFQKYAGKEDFVEYNNSPQVLSGECPKVGRICFIIDEYAEMFKQGKKGSDIPGTLLSILQRVRTSGIFLILCGQNDEPLDPTHLKQIQRRVLLKNFGVKNKREFIKNTDVAMEVDFYLTAAGKGSLSMDSGLSYKNVTLCYSGRPGSSLMLSICEKIRNKYPNFKANQIISGDESLVSIQSDNTLKSLLANNDPNDYSIYIGQGAVSFMPTAVRFSTGQEDSNYFLTGGDKTIENAKRNLILGFIGKHVANGYSTKEPVIYDCYFKANKNSAGDCLSQYIGEYPVLGKYVKHIEDDYEIASTILKIAERVEEDGYDEPILLIVHGPSKIKNNGNYESVVGGTLTSADLLEIKQTARKVIEDKVVGKGFSQEKIESLIENYEQSLINQRQKNCPAPSLSKRLVKDELKNLYRYGHLSNVFVVIAEGSYEFIKDYLNTNVYAQNFFISDRIDPTKIQGVTYYPSSCCHVNTKKLVEDEKISATGQKYTTITPTEVSSKIKFYDYNLKENRAWWDDFVKKL